MFTHKPYYIKLESASLQGVLSNNDTRIRAEMKVASCGGVASAWGTDNLQNINLTAVKSHIKYRVVATQNGEQNIETSGWYSSMTKEDSWRTFLT